MNMNSSTTRRRVLLCALVTPLCLLGGALVGGILGGIVHGGLPGHLQEWTKIAIAVPFALAGALAGGALWGHLIARITEVGEPRRMMVAGALGFGLTALAVTLGLTLLEQIIVEQGRGPNLPLHNIFTLLFTPAAFLIACGGAFALGFAAQGFALARRAGLASGLAAGATFLAVNLTLQALGWVVGAPGAAERATMLTVMFTANFAAALVGGGVMSMILLPAPRQLSQPQRYFERG